MALTIFSLCTLASNENMNKTPFTRIRVFSETEIFGRVPFGQNLRFEFPNFHTSNGTPVGTPYNDLYGEAPPERGTYFRLQSQVEVGKSDI